MGFQFCNSQGVVTEMLLDPPDAEQFFRLHRTLMAYVNGRLGIIPGVDNPEGFSALSPETRLTVRDAFLGRMDLIDSFVDENPAHLSGEELEIVRSWRHHVAGRFIIVRQLKKHAIFLAQGESPVDYGVLAVTEPFEGMIGLGLPCMAETVLLPFRGRIVYDGLLRGYNVSFGPGIRRSLNESYKEAKGRQGVITSLPAETAGAKQPSSQPIHTRKPKAKAKRKTTPSASEDVRAVLETIVGMTDRFCHEHLNDEYAMLCRKLAEKLARKRPSPLPSGRPNTWACGIVRTIGWVNFLDDRASEPHMKLPAIDRAFGVAESTGQGKSKVIRTMLKIRQFDHRWTLPSRMDENPMIWMLEVNGFLMDVRRAPREVQVAAFERGLIPYVPADQADDGEDG